jgi:predicted DNA-binding WGR domain protein
MHAYAAALVPALIATLSYGFARIGAALKMRVEDLQSKGSGWLIRLHEKGGKQHMMLCHHALAEALHAHISRINPSRNMFRFYRLGASSPIFGSFAVVKEWGRTGARGRVVGKWYMSEAEAAAAAKPNGHVSARISGSPVTDWGGIM